MGIQPVNSLPKQTQLNNKPKYSPAKITGYAALAAGIASGVLAKNKKIKLHTQLAYAAGILSLAHIGVIEWFHYKYKNKK